MSRVSFSRKLRAYQKEHGGNLLTIAVVKENQAEYSMQFHVPKPLERDFRALLDRSNELLKKAVRAEEEKEREHE